MRVALLVDHSERDLAGLALISAELTQRGIECFLVPSDIAWREIQSLAPDVVFLNYFREKQKPLHRFLLSSGIRIAVLDTEGGIYESFEKYRSTLVADSALRAQVWKYFSWGERTARDLVSSETYREDQVVVSGCPRFDYYTDPWKKAAKKFSSLEVGLEKPIVMVNGNFSIANPRFTTAKKARTNRDGMTAGEIEQIQNLQWQSLEGLVALTKSLAKKYPNVQFVYRPHPFENEKVYEDNFKGLDNVLLSKKGNITTWLQVCTAVIHRGCTTAVEAGFLGVPVLFPSWIPGFAKFEATESVSVSCKNITELKKSLSQIMERKFKIPKSVLESQDRVTRDFFFRVDGRSAERIAETVDSLRRETIPTISTKTIKRWYRSTHNVRSLFKNFFGQLFGKSRVTEPAISDVIAKSEKMMTQEKLDSVLRALQLARPDWNLTARKGKGFYRLGNAEGRSLSLVQKKAA